MVKIIWKEPKEDDPIYKEGFYVRSHNYSREYVKSKKDTNLTEPKQKKSEDKDSTDD